MIDFSYGGEQWYVHLICRQYVISSISILSRSIIIWRSWQSSYIALWLNCEVGFSTATEARYVSRSRRSGNAQKDALNGNFAALGDNWALRRHVIIPATAAKAGALLKLLEFMDSAGEREENRVSELGELFSSRTTLTAFFSDDRWIVFPVSF